MAFAEVKGINLRYERSGQGPRLLFLNGSGATIETAAPIVERLAGRFDVVIHDQRGLGGSAIPPGPYSMADYAADALALLDHVGWARCRVIGISFGGMVAQELAVTAPARVERLALLCTSPGGVGGASYPLHDLAGLAPEERNAVGRRIMDTRFDDAWLESHPLDRALVAAMEQRRRPSGDPEVVRGAWEQLQARRGHDVCDRLKVVSCPTLVAAGRFDGIAPVANAEAIAARIDGAELRVYEGGHPFFVQDPKAMPDVIGFLTTS